MIGGGGGGVSLQYYRQYYRHHYGVINNHMYICLTAKKKADAARHPKTGGGKPPAKPSPAEEEILSNLEGRPSLEGLEGVDTPVSTSTSTRNEQGVQVINLPLQIGNQLCSNSFIYRFKESFDVLTNFRAA